MVTGTQGPFREIPALPASAMQTHQIDAPLLTHWRAASCEEVDCPDFRHGWGVPLAGKDEGDIWQLEHCGRSYVRGELPGYGPAYLYEAGQPCFRASEHRTRLDREELFVVRHGDWRVTAREAKQAGQFTRFSGADAWMDHLHGHLNKFK